MSRYGIVRKLEIVDYINCTVCIIIYPIPYETLLLTCLLLLPLWESVIVLCFGVRYCMSILVLQST